MKFSKQIALLALTIAGSVAVVGCKSNAKMPVNFVAVTSSSYNAEVQFGDYDYKFQGKINQGSNKFTLNGIVQQRHNSSASGGGRMGPGGGGSSSAPTFDGFGPAPVTPGGGEQGGGGGGGWGGFFPGGGGGETKTLESISVNPEAKTTVFINEVTSPFILNPTDASSDVEWTTSDEKIATVNGGSVTPIAAGEVTITGTGKSDPSKTASVKLTVVEEDLAAHNWSVEGTYVFEKGYGYTITFKDEGNTVIHTDFDKTEGRHGFYYRVKIGETASTLKFQAKDPTFKDSLAKDYQKWDVRDSSYIFYAKATGNNNSVATAYMYLHGSDNSVVIDTPSGSERSLTFGLSWEKRGNTVVVKNGDKEYVADPSVNADHPGFRLVYEGNAYFCSLNENVKWKKMLTSDFDGETQYEFEGSYTTSGPDGGTKAVKLHLGKDGKSRLYAGSDAPSFVGTWASNAGVTTVSIDGKDGTFDVGADGKMSIIVRITAAGMFGSSTYEVTMNQVK